VPDADQLAISGDPSEVRELLAMLRRDPDLRQARLELEVPRPSAGHLGEIADTVTAIIPNDALLTAATTTIGVWLGARIRPTRIRLKRGETEVEVETIRGKRAEAYARELFDALHKPPKPEE
jgi:hypothetical protein